MAPDSRFAELIAARLGLDISRLHGSVLRRNLAATQDDLALPDQHALLAALSATPADDRAWRRMAVRLSVPESRFFRNPGLLAMLETGVLAALIEQRRLDGDLRLRLWSAGCAGGEEPYTLALMLTRLLADFERWRIEIVATDVSEEAVARTGVGIFSARAVAGVPEAMAARWLLPVEPRSFQIAPALRALVQPRCDNLAVQPAGRKRDLADFDLILCRNVVMYMTEQAQAAVVARLSAALAPGGVLAFGPSEVPTGRIEGLDRLSGQEGLVFRRPVASPVPDESATADAWPGRSDGPAATSDPGPREHATVAGYAGFSSDPQGSDGAAAPAVPQTAGNRSAHGDTLSAAFWRTCAATAEERGDLAAAEAARRRVLSFGEDALDDRFLLGAVLHRRRKRREARRCLEAVIAAASEPAGDRMADANTERARARLVSAARKLLSDDMPFRGRDDA